MDHNWIYDALTGENAPKHIWNENGICIRCGEDAEEWETGCVEEIVATLRTENTELRARLDKYETDTSTWVVHAQRPGFPQPDLDEEPIAGTA